MVPDVFLAPTETIDFGEVMLGVSVAGVISLENPSSILSCMLLDLVSSVFSDEFTLPRLTAHLEDTSNIFVALTDHNPRIATTSAPARVEVCARVPSESKLAPAYDTLLVPQYEMQPMPEVESKFVPMPEAGGVFYPSRSE
ncbi:hypothetical protein PF001_g11943 [Phytophthora fragariae]|uniref:Uncharacterized protein n=1 Tax=Phytophthora fragariae TaxID=53985 RepID=A0A6A4DIG4_9STRA|nr:hypothetical protein PF011_g24054 [Phytophthora fragariae]KAE9306782.1 hypothetical protein PF001_g11943 [Phytophthora fragariae]